MRSETVVVDRDTEAVWALLRVAGHPVAHRATVRFLSGPDESIMPVLEVEVGAPLRTLEVVRDVLSRLGIRVVREKVAPRGPLVQHLCVAESDGAWLDEPRQKEVCMNLEILLPTA
jgi:hypothetical protein